MMHNLSLALRVQGLAEIYSCSNQVDEGSLCTNSEKKENNLKLNPIKSQPKEL